ncbi:MAG: hypothetical protein ABS68_02210 [Niastella sp. SCN 39-18]|nr:DUF4286 family protein [Sphingobacteriales bacterium]ODT54169.1 MAG: hypothetical protein ABS68_02210 [Niastella sp. SCN 39-18]OJW09547.1 MAG: hypothetical protein BGO53_06640 [Sphingobacteriales bacterium 39-19]
MSFIYNVTIKVTHSIHEDWLHWLKEEHVPEVTGTGCFEKARIVRLLETDDSEGPTYAVQYFANSKADYNRYIELHAANMRQKSFDKWGNQFLAFRSLMEIVN